MYAEPIFVTGCPRSGTSLYCGCLVRSGAVGGALCGATSANPKGQYENSAIRNKLIKPYLRNRCADPLGQDPLPDVTNLPDYPGLRHMVLDMLKEQKVNLQNPWFIKVCKACLIWPVFEKAFPEAKWVIIRRKKEDIITSCLNTSFMRKRRTREEWAEWVDHHVSRFDEMKKFMPDRTFEVWPTKMINGDLTEVKESIEWLGLDWNEDAIVEWIDKSIWHGE